MWAKGFLGAAIIVLYLTFSFPWYIDAAVVLALLALVRRGGPAELAMALASLSLCALSVEFLFPARQGAEFYREHEKWTRDAVSYHPLINDSIAIPHGDLLALSPMADPAIIEPRSEVFITDSLGYRNRNEYGGEKLVVVGDSFVVGNGSDQADTLPEILQMAAGVSTYSLGFPSSPLDYEQRAEAFLPRMDKTARFLFVIFEGNDFDMALPAYGKEMNAYDRFRGKLLKRHLGGLKYPRIVFGMSRRAERLIRGDAGAAVKVQTIGGKAVGFYRRYMDASLFPRPTLAVTDPREVVGRLACVAFVPTKYRVYKPWISDGATLPEPAPAWEELRRHYQALGVPVVDLTPALRDAAAKGLDKGEFVFWRDDTHWNGSGMRAAAPAIARCLTGQPAR